MNIKEETIVLCDSYIFLSPLIYFINICLTSLTFKDEAKDLMQLESDIFSLLGLA